MAIISHDTYTIESTGIAIVNIYINLQNMVFQKLDDKMILQYSFNIYASQAARDNNKKPVSFLSYEDELVSIPTDLFVYVYDKLKTIYTNYSDC